MNIVFPRSGTRNLQRKLYLKAKQDPLFCFYSLYDKIYRPDILQRAYELVKEKGGSPGLDGRTFQQIEREEGRQVFIDSLIEELKQHSYKTQPVKRVYIPKGKTDLRPLGIPTVKDRVVQMAAKLVLEPIFEADFSDNSFGYRPKRHAHHAMDSITKVLRSGFTEVIDADLSKYFDTIPHDNLLRTVAERVSDGAMLALLKQWLKAPVVEERDGRYRIAGGGSSCSRGTPQGGVISPLLANIYLNLLDRVWQRHDVEKLYGARLVRYADDMVILCRRESETPLAILSRVLEKLELRLNTEKTTVVNAYEKPFCFLGFTVNLRRSERTGNYYPAVEPSKKSILKIKERVKWITRRHMTLVPMKDIVRMTNEVLRGWGNYFRYGNCFRVLRRVRTFCENRVRTHLCYRHKIRSKISGFSKFPRSLLYSRLRLYLLDVKPLWKTAHALG